MFEKKTGIVSRYFLFSFPGDVGIQWKSNMSDSSGINWYKNKILNSVDYFLVLMLRRGVYERLAIIPSRWENNSQRLRQNVGTFFTLNELQLLFQGNPRFDPDSVFSITGFRGLREITWVSLFWRIVRQEGVLEARHLRGCIMFFVFVVQKWEKVDRAVSLFFFNFTLSQESLTWWT